MAIRVRLHTWWLVAVMILALPDTSSAQGTGTISGAITDSTSAVLPGATVIVKNTETGQWREVVTDVRGRYSAPNLVPGPSEITAVLISDWEVGSLVRLRSGQPFSVFVGYDQNLQVWSPVYPDLAPGASANPVGGGPDQYYDPLAFTLPDPGVIGNAPRNSLIGPGFATWDLMTSRNIRFGPGGKSLQLRFEVFNLLHRANFGIPSQSLFAANGTRLADAGRITTLASAPRQAQLGVKFVW